MKLDQEKSETGFKILNLLLMESEFKRASKVSFNETGIDVKVDINVETNILDSKVVVKELLTFEQTFADTKEIVSRITYIGVFEASGESGVSLEEFGNVNGAAIIFPYIREHFS